jgi:hypothetical protein
MVAAAAASAATVKLRVVPDKVAVLSPMPVPQAFTPFWIAVEPASKQVAVIGRVEMTGLFDGMVTVKTVSALAVTAAAAVRTISSHPPAAEAWLFVTVFAVSAGIDFSLVELPGRKRPVLAAQVSQGNIAAEMLGNLLHREHFLLHKPL